MSTEQREIRRHVDIAAKATTVWELISRPGWWINEGRRVDESTVETTDDGTSIIRHDTLGEFHIVTVRMEEPRIAAYRWQPRTPDEPATLIEFTITERAEGGVRLDVVESDFGDLTDDDLTTLIDENTSGWERELSLAKRTAEADAA